MRVTVYGIPNCDTVKRARAWLQSEGVEVEFHNFKTRGIRRELVSSWLKGTDFETLLNRRGLTWRKLPDARKAEIKDYASAIDLMLEQPGTIKRPMLEYGGKVLVGFDAASYAKLIEAR
jgi:arsenate reductase (glutaredoxin)